MLLGLFGCKFVGIHQVTIVGSSDHLDILDDSSQRSGTGAGNVTLVVAAVQKNRYAIRKLTKQRAAVICRGTPESWLCWITVWTFS